MNNEKIPVVKPTEIEKLIWARNTCNTRNTRNTRTSSGEGLPLGMRMHHIGHSHNQHGIKGNNTRNTLNPRKTGGLVRSKAFVFADVLEWPEWYKEPDKLNPEHWESKLLAGCRGEWFAHAVEGARRVLDVGCGFGFPSFYLARHGHEVVGVDPSPSEIETARELAKRIKPSGNVRFEVMEQNIIPFEDSSFDAATLGHSLECACDPEALLIELKRVLEAGSPVAIEEEDRSLEPVPLRGIPISSKDQKEITPETHPVWEKSSWAFVSGETWLAYEVRVSDPYLDRRYTMKLDPLSDIAQGIENLKERALTKEYGMPVVRFDKAGITWDEALKAVTEASYSEARGWDGISLGCLLESSGFKEIRFHQRPSGREFAAALREMGLLESMPGDVRGVLRALVRSVPSATRPVSTLVSCITPGGANACP